MRGTGRNVNGCHQVCAEMTREIGAEKRNQRHHQEKEERERKEREEESDRRQVANQKGQGFFKKVMAALRRMECVITVGHLWRSGDV